MLKSDNDLTRIQKYIYIYIYIYIKEKKFNTFILLFKTKLSLVETLLNYK